MVSITLSIPEEVKHRMERFPEINWSGLIRKTIEGKTKELCWREEMQKKFKEEESLTEWAVKLQKKTREKRFEELKKKGLV